MLITKFNNGAGCCCIFRTFSITLDIGVLLKQRQQMHQRFFNHLSLTGQLYYCNWGHGLRRLSQ